MFIYRPGGGGGGLTAPVDDSDLKGGWQAVADLTARDAIDSGSRKEGMCVWVLSENKGYILLGGITNGDWAEAPFTGTETVKIIADDTTNGAITLAVNGATGSDTPTTTRPSVILEGDHSAEPFETIQAAIDALPRNIMHSCAINVAAGTYTSFELRDRNLGTYFYNWNLFQINGTPVASSPTTGPASGTATGGSSSTLVLAAAGWTPDDLIGKFVEITSGPGSGQILIIAENTADTITFAGVYTAMGAGSVFEIKEPGVIISGAGGAPASTGIWVNNVKGYSSIRWMDVDNPYYGIVGITCPDNFGLRYVTVHSPAWGGGSIGFLAQDCGRVAWNQIGQIGGCGDGLYLIDVAQGANQSNGWLSKGVSNYNMRFTGVQSGYVQGASFQDGGGLLGYYSVLGFENTKFTGGNYGCSLVNCWTELDSCDFSNFATTVFWLHDAYIYADGLSGSGNAGWGVRLDANGNGSNTTFHCNQVPTITGANGDVTLDGNQTLSWAADFASAGDYALDIARGNRIVRE